MLERSHLVHGCVLLLFVFGKAQSGTGTAAQVGTPPGAAQKHFEQGKKLIENNCIDCMGGSQTGMEEGVQEVEAALQAGYRNRKAAYKLLSDGYTEMTTYSEKDPEVEKAYATKLVKANRKLYELDPNDPDVLERYERILDDDSEKIEILRRLLRIKPQPAAKFLLGDLLFKQHKTDEGLPLIRSAIATDRDGESVINYVRTLIGELSDMGCPLAGADQWQHKAQEAFDRATTGHGDPSALRDFKKTFLAALDKNKCAGG